MVHKMSFRKYLFLLGTVTAASVLFAFAGMAAEEDSGAYTAIPDDGPSLIADMSEKENTLDAEVAEETGEEDVNGEAVTLEAQYRTQDEIRAYVKDHSFTYPSASYVTAPVTMAPYAAGKLNPSVLQNAITELNVMRYIAGVPNDVTLSDDYEEMAQASALISAVNGNISHSPTQPADMSADLYNQAYEGCSKSNLAAGYYSLGSAVLDAWLGDRNVAGVGHRWWALHPGLNATAFGWCKNQSSSYGNYYSMDVIHSNNSGTKMTGVVWPARNMPVEYFSSSTPWSITIGYPSYSNQHETQPNAVVSLTRKSDGKNWTFSASDQSAGKFEAAEKNNTLVFYPGGITYSDGDVFDVKVENLNDDKTLEYTVNFFELSDSGSSFSGSSSSSRSSSSSERRSSSSSDRASSSSSSERRSSSSSKSYTSSSKITDGGSEDSTAKYKMITKAKGDTLVVGQKGYLKLTGVKNKDVTLKGKTGYYKNGVVYSDKKGKITLMAPFEKKGKLKSKKVCVIKVEEPKLKKTLSLKRGREMQLKISGTKTTADKWVSSNPSIARVTSSGLVTAKKSGECDISAYIGDYVCKCHVKVK